MPQNDGVDAAAPRPATNGRAYWFPRRGDTVRRYLVDARWLAAFTLAGTALGAGVVYSAVLLGAGFLVAASLTVAAAVAAFVLAWGIRRGDDLRVRMEVTVGERASVARVENADP